MYYNTDLASWKSWRKESPGKKYTIIEGHVFAGNDCVARFHDQEEALNTLSKAGFLQQPESTTDKPVVKQTIAAPVKSVGRKVTWAKAQWNSTVRSYHPARRI